MKDPGNLLGNKEYNFFIIKNGEIVGGNEYKSDAKDTARDIGGDCKVYTRLFCNMILKYESETKK